VIPQASTIVREQAVDNETAPADNSVFAVNAARRPRSTFHPFSTSANRPSTTYRVVVSVSRLTRPGLSTVSTAVNTLRSLNPIWYSVANLEAGRSTQPVRHTAVPELSPTQPSHGRSRQR